jgi:hypothetical protein
MTLSLAWKFEYLKYVFIAGLPKSIMQLVAAKDPATFTEAHDEATRLQELSKARNDIESSVHHQTKF